MVPTKIRHEVTVDVGLLSLKLRECLDNPVCQEHSALENVFQHIFSITTKLFIIKFKILNDKLIN